jgi:hypothetical protein
LAEERQAFGELRPLCHAADLLGEDALGAGHLEVALLGGEAGGLVRGGWARRICDSVARRRDSSFCDCDMINPIRCLASRSVPSGTV